MPSAGSKIIAEADAFGELAPAWWELWRRCPTATPFQTPAWLLAWWRQFAPGPLRTGAAFRDGQLVGLFPFYLDEDRRLLPVGISLSDYLDVLVPPECPEAGSALVECSATGSWDSWEFEELPPNAAALALERPNQCPELIKAQHACPVLALDGPDDLSGCVPARRRRQLRRACAAARRIGPLCIESLEHREEAFLDTLFALHAARWESCGETGVLADPLVQQFHRQALPALAAEGMARCYVLTVDGRAAAAYYGFVVGERAYAYLGGFHPDYTPASPGAILIGHAIGEAMHEGAREFHFLRGREAYKYTWGAVDRWNQHRSWVRPKNS
ncbi:MAG: GNAT family N-acetyltransferase [Methylobacteriaceae bacterium]|nr:GNAT family N-acetyltransferase [Methylobacteriaceae bacterium]